MKKLMTFAVLLALLSSGCTAEPKYRSIPQDEAVRMMEEETGYIILDVRTPEEYATGHIPGSICIPSEKIDQQKNDQLPDLNQLIFVYCRSGNRSKEASENLAKAGYTRVFEIGSISTWPYPIVSDEELNLVRNILILDDHTSGEKDGIVLSVTDYSEGILLAQLENHSGKTFEYGEQFVLKYHENDEWTEVEWPPDMSWTAIAYVLEDGASAEVKCRVGPLEPLKAGEYMLVKDGIEAYFWLVATE